ncbi:VC0807 family protein [Streptomyces sp. MST-110588]|uniref:VC0807 family protein n=1 Tax=Streptomyces sp. MST-110588 TaxID=2833628 RepID=UPI001F5D0ECB|nr:VC0807 family protein [Streptomyces sp. MST-110588]UNO39018.1 hypothetical protein KGS77_04440 [Streptomyces sp. MST-110588]
MAQPAQAAQAAQPAQAAGRGPWGPLARTLAVNLFAPLVLFALLRAHGAAQWSALLISSAVPALRIIWTLAVHRRADGFDLFVLGMLLVSAGTSLISGSPRVLLLKDVGLSAALGLWIVGSLRARRPFAYEFGVRLRGGATAADRDRLWRESPALRHGLRTLTAIWGAGQLLDAGVGVLTSLTLPVDVVPFVGRIQTLVVFGATVLVTLRYARRFRARYGISLLGTRATAAPGRPAPARPPGSGTPSSAAVAVSPAPRVTAGKGAGKGPRPAP